MLTKHQQVSVYSIKLSNYCLCLQAGTNPRQIRWPNGDMQLRKVGSEPHSLQGTPGSERKHLTKVPSLVLPHGVATQPSTLVSAAVQPVLRTPLLGASVE